MGSSPSWRYTISSHNVVALRLIREFPSCWQGVVADKQIWMYDAMSTYVYYLYVLCFGRLSHVHNNTNNNGGCLVDRSADRPRGPIMKLRSADCRKRYERVQPALHACGQINSRNLFTAV